MARNRVIGNHHTLLGAFLMLFVLLFAFGCGSDQQPESNQLWREPSSVETAVVQAGYYEADSFTDSFDQNSLFSLMFNYGISEKVHLDAILDYVLSTIPNDSDPFYFAYLRVKEGTEESIVGEIADIMEKSYPSYVVSQMEHYGSHDSVEIAKAFVLRKYQNGVLLFTAMPSDRDTILSLVEGLKDNH